MRAKVFIFGLDGGTFDIILPLARQGRLPHFARLISEGYRATLESTTHPITAAAWTSFATGCNPGRHGIYDFQSPHPKGYGFRLNSARDRRCPPFWTLLHRAGLKTITVNVPFTYPPDRDGGVVIAGFDAPGASRAMAWPPEIFDELAGRFGSYTPDWTFPAGRKYDPETYWESVRTTIHRRTESTLHLMQSHDWDVFTVVYGSVDHLQHIYYGLGDEGRRTVEKAYVLMDEALGRILGRLEPSTALWMVSDHGFGAIRRFVYLDRWLEREGFLRYRSAFTLTALARSAIKWTRRRLKRLLPVRMRGYLRGRLPGIRDFVVSHSTGPEIDWSRTQAYSGGMYGNIYINRRGRQPQGVVPDSDYEHVCDAIRRRLLQLRDPVSGEAVVEKVFHRGELYRGECVDLAPDLLVKWTDYAYFTKKGIDRKGDVFGNELTLDASSYPHTGTHRLDGILIMRGPGIDAGGTGHAAIIDIAPSLLHYLGQPVPDYMDGRVLSEPFTEEFRRGHSVSTSHTAPSSSPHQADPRDEDVKELEGRLRSLGYIE